MADTKITALTAITTVDPAVDVLPIVDVSDTTMAASGTTKKITSNQILGAGGTATLASATITGNATSAAFIPSGSTVPTNGLYLPAANSLGFAYNSTLGMTLNSTGLGIGGSPVNPLTVFAATSAKAPALLLSTAGSPTYGWDFSVDGAVNGNLFIRRLVAGVKTDVLEFDRSSGNLGLGVTPSAWGFGGQINVGGGSGLYSKANGSYVGSNCYYNGAWKYASAGYASYYYQYNGTHQWWKADSGAAVGDVLINHTQAMTLDASGNLLVGTTSALASGTTFQNLGSARQVLTLKGNDQTSYTFGVWSASATGDNLFQYFGTETSLTVRGSVSYNRAGGLVAYNTTSDYRAKDIIGPVLNSGSLIDSLKVYVGKMKGATIERPMLIAHEVQEVAPYSVTGTKDEVDSDGKPKYQQMDASALVPLLIAEIQSLRARVQTLEAR